MAKRKQPKGVRPKPKNPWKRYGETYSHSPDWSDCCGPITEANGYSSADVRDLAEERENERYNYTSQQTSCQTPPATPTATTTTTTSAMTPEEEARIELLAQQEDLRNWYHRMEGMEDLYENEYNV